MTPLDPFALSFRKASLIEASAGTGKTTTITLLVLRALLEDEDARRIDQILVVTYTRAATAELRDRIRRALVHVSRAFDGEPIAEPLAELVKRRLAAGQVDRDRARIGDALRNFDRAAIFTIHGFCQRTLFESAFESNAPFEVELVADVAPLVEEVVHDHWARTICRAPPSFALELRSDRKGAGFTPARRLALHAVRHPRMPVLPETAELHVPDDEDLERLLDACASLWRRDRERILHLLCDGEDLNRQSYKQATIRERWAPALDAFAAPGRSFEPECVGKLTPAVLEDGTNTGHDPPSHPFFDACGQVIAARLERQASLGDALLAARRDLVDYARSELARRKHELRVQSFDDLLHGLDAALAGKGGPELADQIARGTKLVLIDEFQDTDPVQYAIFWRLHEMTGTPLVLIGDPKQSIYGFRGADVFAYVAASRRVGGARFSLDTNRRSDRRLVGAVNSLFSNAPRPFALDEVEFKPVNAALDAAERVDGPGAPAGALTFLFAPRANWTDGDGPIAQGVGEARVAKAVAAEIARLLDSDVRVNGDPIRPRHVAVLCRTNDQARQVQRWLRDLRVPSVLDGDSSVFEAPIAIEVEAMLEALALPSDVRRVRAAAVGSLFGVDAAALHGMQQREHELEVWLDRFARCSALWHERGFVQAVHQLLGETNARAVLLSRSDGERRVTDLQHLVELLHDAASRQHLGPLSLLRWFGEMRVDLEARKNFGAEAAQIRLEDDEQAVQLTTVHKSKGLEYPIVFCPFLWKPPFDDKEVLFHDRSDDHRLKLDLRSDDQGAHRAAARAEAIAEALRLCYVALTRARHRCFVVWGRFSEAGKSPLARLLHAPRNVDPKMIDAEVLEKRLATLDDHAMRAEIDALCVRSEGAIDRRDLDVDRPAAPYRSRELPPEAIGARVATRPIPRLPRTSSFTQLVRRAEAASGAAEEGIDRDEQTDALQRQAAPAGATPAMPIALADFPAGAKAGIVLHEIFEHVDFRRDDPDELGREVRDRLGRAGFDVERWGKPVERALAAVLDTPLALGGLQLSAVARADRADELEFMLPVASEGTALDPARLAAVLARHRAPLACPGYAERVAKLDFPALRGHLKGFVDLVFRHGGRYHVVDYKSNWLGTDADDYRPARLADAMAEHHYPLQYLLYTTALHRHLALRLPGYDYDAHVGGVHYLFVRGMAPEHPLGTGVYQDRPSRALVEDLARLFAGREVAS